MSQGQSISTKNRYWYKVQLPGKTKPAARPLVPHGSKYATTDYAVAVELANNIYQQSIYTSQTAKADMPVSNIASMAAAYIAYINNYYVDQRGKTTKEVKDIRYSLIPLTNLFAALPVNEFGPLKLIEVRDSKILSKWSRNLINQRVGRIKWMFKWAVSRQLVSPLVYQGLITVECLKRGRCAARETEKRRPVEETRLCHIALHNPCSGGYDRIAASDRHAAGGIGHHAAMRYRPVRQGLALYPRSS